ncbi:hypothetical protein RBSWK_01536 [Rhodopirellula baltica SWK14]|uniref:Uncharacterized protein n=1 Tax=Rhodopirellula baltica SWK14 TaxID=993516 RepID=L7CNB2_RHOBT|nr:hypothetical protein RBSWK_01536 [Rhodopirellula baltica SWK14]
MNTTDRIQKRFDELEAMAEEIARSCSPTTERVRSVWFDDGQPPERPCERLDTIRYV